MDHANDKKLVATVGCAKIYGQDLACLLEFQGWISDGIINFYLEYLRQYKIKTSFKDKVQILTPTAVNSILCEQHVGPFLKQLNLKKKKLVMFPIQSEKNESGLSTSTWSMLMMSPDKQTFFHIDGSEINRKLAQMVTVTVQNHLKFKKPRLLHLKPKAQVKPWNWSLYTLMYSERVLDYIMDGKEQEREVDCDRMRPHILGLVTKLINGHSLNDEDADIAFLQ